VVAEAIEQLTRVDPGVAHENRGNGVTIPGDVDAAVRKIAETVPGQYSSTAQDLARGKRSEIDHLNGLIVRRGEALGIATPANRLLHAIVKLIESK
jgi:2-dehydropantoate 2-reductase